MNVAHDEVVLACIERDEVRQGRLEMVDVAVVPADRRARVVASLDRQLGCSGEVEGQQGLVGDNVERRPVDDPVLQRDPA